MDEMHKKVKGDLLKEILGVAKKMAAKKRNKAMGVEEPEEVEGEEPGEVDAVVVAEEVDPIDEIIEKLKAIKSGKEC